MKLLAVVLLITTQWLGCSSDDGGTQSTGTAGTTPGGQAGGSGGGTAGAGGSAGNAEVKCERDLSPLSFSIYMSAARQPCVKAQCCDEAGACAVSAACVELGKCLEKCGAATGPNDPCISQCRGAYPEDVNRAYNEFSSCAGGCFF